MKLSELLSPELYAQVQARIDEVNAGQTDKTKHVRFADLSEGGYVSVDKHNSQVNALTQQVTALQGQIAQRDTDMTGLQEKLTAAQADTAKLATVQTELTGLQTKYETEKQEWAQQSAAQAYEFAVKTEAGKLKFTSAAAQRDFVRGAIDKKMQMENDRILGFTDYVEAYKQSDPGAFVVEQPEQEQEQEPEGSGKPQIVLPKNQKPDAEKSVFGFHFNGVRPRPADEQ